MAGELVRPYVQLIVCERDTLVVDYQMPAAAVLAQGVTAVLKQVMQAFPDTPAHRLLISRADEHPVR